MKFIIAFLAIFFLISCTIIDTESYVYSKNEPFNGINREPPPSSLNPVTRFVTRCFREFPMDTGERAFLRKVEKGKARLLVKGNKIIDSYYHYAPNDGLNWRRGDLMWVVFYLEEKER